MSMNYQEQITVSFIDELEKIGEYKEAGLPSAVRKNPGHYGAMGNARHLKSMGQQAGALMAKGKKLQETNPNASAPILREAAKLKDRGVSAVGNSRTEHTVGTGSLSDRLKQYKADKAANGTLVRGKPLTREGMAANSAAERAAEAKRVADGERRKKLVTGAGVLAGATAVGGGLYAHMKHRDR